MVTETGLVAAYDFTAAVGDRIADLSGNGYTLTRDGPMLKSNRGIASLGGRYVTTKTNAQMGGDFSVSFRFYSYNSVGGVNSTVVSFGGTGTAFVWLYVTTAGHVVLDQNSGGAKQFSIYFKQFAAQTVTLTFENSTHTTRCYVNGAYFGEGTTYNPSGSRTGVMSVGNYSNGYVGYRIERSTLVDLRLYSRIISDKEIKDYHDGFVLAPRISEDFSNYPVGSVSSFGPWVKSSGAFSVQELISDDTVLTHLKKRTKYLKSTNLGTIAIKNNIAFGTWEWDWMKPTNSATSFYMVGKNMLVYPNSLESYAFASNTNYALWLGKISGTTNTYPYNSADSYVQAGIWYTTKITRTYAGVFTIYTKGGSFGNTYRLISASGGSGSNPCTDIAYTVSQYFVFYPGAANQCFANLKIYDGIVL